MSLSTLEAYDLIRFAEAFEARLATASDVIAEREGLGLEKEWMATALRLVREALVPAPSLIERAKDLPELEEAREEFSFQQQNLWVDCPGEAARGHHLLRQQPRPRHRGALPAPQVPSAAPRSSRGRERVRHRVRAAPQVQLRHPHLHAG